MRKMHHILTVTLVAILGLLLPVGPSSHAVDNGDTDGVKRKISIVHLGDSYSAGNGAGAYELNSGDSYRSTRNWGRLYTKILNSQGISATYTNLAHSGNVTDDVLNQQIPLVPHNADLVLITIGGNDVNFAQIVEQCFAAIIGNVHLCDKHIKEARKKLPRVKENTRKIFEKLSERLSSDAEVVLSAYPLLANANDVVRTACVKYDKRRCLKRFVLHTGKEVRRLGQEARKMQQDLVDEWNKSANLRVTYVGEVVEAFSGHEPDPSAAAKNPRRWINEFFETNGIELSDGSILSVFSKDSANFYHPNVSGHLNIAKQVWKKMGIPASARLVDGAGEDIDIVFVVDATGSMEDNIDQVRANIRDVVKGIEKQAKSYRLALVTYKDHPEFGGDPEDYPARLSLDFTTDVLEFESALSDIQVAGGGDTPETVLSGVMEGLKLNWRPGVRKTVLVLGDAPGKNPEPVTGYTAESVAKVAFEIDPVEIYGIDTSELSEGPMEELSRLSGGRIYDLGENGDIPEFINDALNTALGKPFAWIQGPVVGYVGEVIELDARGSYAIDGTITSYEWDFNGDGTYEETTQDGFNTHTFNEALNETIGVRVTTSEGLSAVGSTAIRITPIPESDETPPPIEESREGFAEYSGNDAKRILEALGADSGYLSEEELREALGEVSDSAIPNTSTPHQRPGATLPIQSGDSEPTPPRKSAPSEESVGTEPLTQAEQTGSMQTLFHDAPSKGRSEMNAAEGMVPREKAVSKLSNTGSNLSAGVVFGISVMVLLGFVLSQYARRLCQR